MNTEYFRRTTDDKPTAAIRLLLGMMFLMAGAAKLLVPMLAEAWSGQLLAAGIPLHTLNRWAVPFVEIAIGAALAAGYFARPAAVMVIGIMIVAIHVHLVVNDPSLFPLQPAEPVIPPIVMAMSTLILWRGAGAWSLDLERSGSPRPRR